MSQVDPWHEDRTIALVSISAEPLLQLEVLRPAIKSRFGAHVVVGPRLPLPGKALDRDRSQYLAVRLLEELAAAGKPEWDRLLGVTDVDLYAPNLNFVFGEADREKGAAVFSIVRLRTGRAPFGRDEVLRRRSVVEAIHELAHTYGLGHCQDSRCVMWFSNTLAETDQKSADFCPRHARELSERARFARGPARP